MDIIKLLIATSVLIFCQQTLAAENNTTETMRAGSEDFAHYCARCHGKEGQGRIGPNLHGDPVVTGSVSENIHTVIFGVAHTKMPSWGETPLTDKVFANIITYIRNSWGNNDKAKFGKQAGGIVTEKMIQQERDKVEPKTTTDSKQL